MKKQITVFIFALVLLFVVVGCASEVTDMEWGVGTYTGEVNEDDKPHGQGTEYNADGTIEYEGEWKDGWKHGQGTLYREDGTKWYEGEWKDGLMHGQGTQYWPDGRILYEGEFKDGKPVY